MSSCQAEGIGGGCLAAAYYYKLPSTHYPPLKTGKRRAWQPAWQAGEPTGTYIVRFYAVQYASLSCPDTEPDTLGLFLLRRPQESPELPPDPRREARLERRRRLLARQARLLGVAP